MAKANKSVNNYSFIKPTYQIALLLSAIPYPNSKKRIATCFYNFYNLITTFFIIVSYVSILIYNITVTHDQGTLQAILYDLSCSVLTLLIVAHKISAYLNAFHYELFLKYFQEIDRRLNIDDYELKHDNYYLLVKFTFPHVFLISLIACDITITLKLHGIEDFYSFF